MGHSSVGNELMAPVDDFWFHLDDTRCPLQTRVANPRYFVLWNPSIGIKRHFRTGQSDIGLSKMLIQLDWLTRIGEHPCGAFHLGRGWFKNSTPPKREVQKLMQDKCDSRMHRAVYLAYLRRKTQALALVPAFQNGVVDCTYSRNLGRKSRIQRSRRWEDLKRENPLYPHIFFKSLRKIATVALFRNVFSKNTYMIRSRDFFLHQRSEARGEHTVQSTRKLRE